MKGAVIGSDEFKSSYVDSKIETWIKDIEYLSDIASEDPQAAFSECTKGLSHRRTFMQQTVDDISNNFVITFRGWNTSEIHPF